MYNARGRILLALRFQMCAQVYKNDRIDIHQSHNRIASGVMTFAFTQLSIISVKMTGSKLQVL